MTAERTYTLAQITRAADAPFAEALQQPSVDRALRLFVQGLIDALKAPPDPQQGLADQTQELRTGYGKDDQAQNIYHRNPPRLPQKSDL